MASKKRASAPKAPARRKTPRKQKAASAGLDALDCIIGEGSGAGEVLTELLQPDATEVVLVSEGVLRLSPCLQHPPDLADHVGMGTVPASPDYLAEVAKALAAAKAILICGPGKARTELAGYLNEHAPTVAKRVWGIEPMDHPTDREMLAAARKYFRGADRMHA